MPQNLLTDAKVRSVKPVAKSFKLADGGGLFLLVRPSGAKLWRWKFRLAGKEGLFAVGVFPALGLAGARHARDAARVVVAKGINPAHERAEERRTNIADAEARRRETDGAFGKLADAWLEDGKAIWAPGTYRQKRSRVTRFGPPPPLSVGGSLTIRRRESNGLARAHTRRMASPTPPSKTMRSAPRWTTPRSSCGRPSRAGQSPPSRSCARQAGIAEKTLRRAGRAIGAVSRKQSFSGKWEWELPKLVPPNDWPPSNGG
jgi:Arm DNA-binding domain